MDACKSYHFKFCETYLSQIRNKTRNRKIEAPEKSDLEKHKSNPFQMLIGKHDNVSNQLAEDNTQHFTPLQARF